VDETEQQQDEFEMDCIIRSAHFYTLTPEQQELYLRHLEDQFNAVPSYVERLSNQNQ
jgi:hypothetical protein